MVNPFVVFELRACIKDVEYSLSTELAGFKLRKKNKQSAAQIGCVMCSRPDIGVALDEESVCQCHSILVRRLSCNKRHER